MMISAMTELYLNLAVYEHALIRGRDATDHTSKHRQWGGSGIQIR